MYIYHVRNLGFRSSSDHISNSEHNFMAWLQAVRTDVITEASPEEMHPVFEMPAIRCLG